MSENTCHATETSHPTCAPSDWPVRSDVDWRPDHTGGCGWTCRPGQPGMPVGCVRHREHRFCWVCDGWFAVDHERMHAGEHPTVISAFSTRCPCRPCGALRGEHEPPP